MTRTCSLVFCIFGAWKQRTKDTQALLIEATKLVARVTQIAADLLQCHAGLLAHGYVAATRAKADALAQYGRMLRKLLNKVQQSADLSANNQGAL